MTRPIRAQIERMRRAWPTFRAIRKSNTFVCWEGALTPIMQTYTVRVSYCNRCDLDRSDILRGKPRITVIDPLLRHRVEEPEEHIPHHYPNKADPDRPLLCLYDPAADEWKPSDTIADTIIPWTIDWLACYEGWLATGLWSGGGRHPSIN